MTDDLTPADAFPPYDAGWTAAPAGFADRVTAAALALHRTHRRRIRLARAGGLALTASVALAVAIGIDRRNPPQPDVAEIRDPLPPVVEVERVAPIQKPFAEAGEAIADITRRATDKALAPSMTILASAERLPMPGAVEEAPALESKALADATEGARAGLEPVAGQPRRAMNRMLRDFGLASASKPRS